MHDTQPYDRVRSPQARPIRRAAPPPRQVNWRRRIKIAAFILILAIVAATIVIWQRAAAFNDTVSTESAFSMRLFGPFAGGERVNVLLLGYSDESRDGAFLSDSINVLSIDRATDETALIAIPRDLWVEGVAEVPQNMKVNEALRIGYYAGGIENGAELASKAAAQVTGLDIHGWIALDFQGFEAMVDAIGGVTLENPTAFSYTWDETRYFAGAWEGSFEAGTLQLSGQEALDYARVRYASEVAESSDFARSVRQQTVLRAIRAKVNGWRTLPDGLAVSGALEDHLKTNLGVLDLVMLAGKLDVDRRVELTEGAILQASTNSIGQYILVVIGQATSADYAPLHSYIQEQLNAPLPTPEPSGSLEGEPPL